MPMTFPCPFCQRVLVSPRYTDDGVAICPMCGEEIEPPEGWGRGDVAPASERASAAENGERADGEPEGAAGTG